MIFTYRYLIIVLGTHYSHMHLSRVISNHNCLRVISKLIPILWTTEIGKKISKTYLDTANTQSIFQYCDVYLDSRRYRV